MSTSNLDTQTKANLALLDVGNKIFLSLIILYLDGDADVKWKLDLLFLIFVLLSAQCSNHGISVHCFSYRSSALGVFLVVHVMLLLHLH